MRYWKGDGKVTFTRPFLLLVKMAFEGYINVFERYCTGDVSNLFTKP